MKEKRRWNHAWLRAFSCQRGLQEGAEILVRERSILKDGSYITRKRRCGRVLHLYQYHFYCIMEDGTKESFRYNEFLGYESRLVRLQGSKEAMNASIDTMNQLTESFGGLNQQFESLYVNIEEQNYSISQIDGIFEELNGKVSDMHISAMKNQNAVDDIAKALDAYSENISSVIENTRV